MAIHRGSSLSQATLTRLPLFLRGKSCQKVRLGGCEREAAGQIKQIIVSRRSVYRQLVMESLYEKVANPIPVSPDRYLTGLASSAAGSFPRVRPHLVCGANGTTLHFSLAWQIPR